MSGNGRVNGGGRRGRIAKQVVLPFRKSLEISLKSLRVRFFRSLITVLTLVLAVAFLCYVLVSSDVASGMLRSGDPGLREMLGKAGYDLRPGMTEAGSSPTERWIVLLSLLVCTVGIVNAQLMAVTERFREIGTMKCLGALDSFVLRLFLLEAGIQGGIGAAAGALMGALAALLAGLARFGTASLSRVSGADLAASLGMAAATGLLLSLAGVVYPAIVAARMQPVEAMRVQE